MAHFRIETPGGGDYRLEVHGRGRGQPTLILGPGEAKDFSGNNFRIAEAGGEPEAGERRGPRRGGKRRAADREGVKEDAEAGAGAALPFKITNKGDKGLVLRQGETLEQLEPGESLELFPGTFDTHVADEGSGDDAEGEDGEAPIGIKNIGNEPAHLSISGEEFNIGPGQTVDIHVEVSVTASKRGGD